MLSIKNVMCISGFYHRSGDAIMNNIKRNIFLLFVICIGSSSCSKTSDIAKHNLVHAGILIVDHLSDNEKETRFRWKGLTGKETTLDMDVERYANR